VKHQFMLIAAAIAAVCGASETPAQTQAPAPPPDYGLAIDYAHARIAADAAMAASKAMNLGSDIAIVGPAGELILFEKMDGTLLASVDISQAKAHTAVAFKRPSKAFRDLVDAGTNYVLAMPDTIPSEGGVPIIVGGKIIGAIGVSGGNGTQDGAVAKAGADAVAAAAK
jgi:uncharacterized protein GlcG (DUF336 family)